MKQSKPSPSTPPSDLVRLLNLREKLRNYISLSEKPTFDSLLENAKVYRGKQGEQMGQSSIVAAALITSGSSALRYRLEEVLRSQGASVQAVHGVMFRDTTNVEVSKLVRHLLSSSERVVVTSADLGHSSIRADFSFMAAAGYRVPNIGHRDPTLIAHDLLTQVNLDYSNLLSEVQAQISRKAAQAVNEGKDAAQVATAASDLSMLSNRSDLIMRWGSVRAFNSARLDAIQEAKRQIPGLRKVWVAVMDGNTCEWCAALHGTVIDVEAGFDESQGFSNKSLGFYGDKLSPPRHPRCRCTVVPWLDEWGQDGAVSPRSLTRDALDWAKGEGHPPKAFGPTTLQGAEEELRRAKGLLSSPVSRMTTDDIQTQLAMLEGVSRNPDFPKAVKMAATATAGSLRSYLDYKLAQDEATAAAQAQDSAALEQAINKAGVAAKRSSALSKNFKKLSGLFLPILLLLRKEEGDYAGATDDQLDSELDSLGVVNKDSYSRLEKINLLVAAKNYKG